MAGAQSIGGLASGLDTASIISGLMQIEKQPQVRIQQKIVVEQARQQALRDVLTQLNSLTTAYQNLTDVGTWADTQSVTSSDDARISATRTAGAAPGAYTIDVTQLARANQFTSAGTGPVAADDVLHITTASGTTDVAVTAGDTLDTVAGKINATTGSPVYATMLNGQLVLSDKTSGTAARITGVTTNGGSGLSFSETQTAQDAAFKIDGVAKTSSSNVVTDALAGITLTLKGLTTGASITVGSPAPNTENIQKQLDAFVTQYNTTLESLLGKLNEQPVPGAKTDADRAKGVLNGDPGLESLVSSLRNTFADVVTGRPSTLQTFAQVGVSTGAATGSGSLSSDSIDGKLVVDSAKFTSALSSNFDDVKALFTNATGNYASEGLAQRLGDLLKPWTASSASNGVLNTRIDQETTTIDSLQKQSANWDVRLALRQQILERQFAAMETALQNSQTQQAWLTGQLASLQNNR